MSPLFFVYKFFFFIYKKSFLRVYVIENNSEQNVYNFIAIFLQNICFYGRFVLVWTHITYGIYFLKAVAKKRLEATKCSWMQVNLKANMHR